MRIFEGGQYYKNLSKWNHFEDVLHYMADEDLEEAYRLARGDSNSQMPRDLTLYIIYESSGCVLHDDPLDYMEYVPEYFLYECDDKNLYFYISQKEIKSHAFCYCSIKGLCISKNVEKIGESALRLNSGEIRYEGTKQEFIDKFFGKSCCFLGTNGQILKCSDGDLEIKG